MVDRLTVKLSRRKRQMHSENASDLGREAVGLSVVFGGHVHFSSP